ncbi:hypothetical protein [Oceanisphaera psychrotolerans]|uniref:Uncharacterized protein n=1 Tax=Oceanisphaera psychrotolerans TaxID=1414654 RepID=A0A1J4Q9T9_9GAMM|nr:hypothetical protein [Oceanisphaera psychrotolerans]OIN04799.1 hypothetical protein BFR47_05755 [Oceanisphaera psychrotolerans]
MKLYPLLLCGLLAACSSQPPAEQAEAPASDTTPSQTAQEVTPKGEFAQIDVSRSQQAMDAITSGKGDTINEILKSPNDYAPPVLYLMSAIMFDNDYQDQATFWYYAAQLRARSDANKSGDKTAHGAVNQLNQRFGARIAPASLSNPDRLQSIVSQVLEWDSEQTRNYDARWIALQSKDVVTETKVNFMPREKWQEIDAMTRNQFRQGLDKALTRLRQAPAQ